MHEAPPRHADPAPYLQATQAAKRFGGFTALCMVVPHPPKGMEAHKARPASSDAP
jgi:hypothetical protein